MEIDTLRNVAAAARQSQDARVKDTKDAAREFEAIMIGKLLESAFADGKTGFGDSEDSGGQTMLEFGREHLARVIAQGGGLGLAKIVERGLGGVSATPVKR